MPSEERDCPGEEEELQPIETVFFKWKNRENKCCHNVPQIYNEKFNTLKMHLFEVPTLKKNTILLNTIIFHFHRTDTTSLPFDWPPWVTAIAVYAIFHLPHRRAGWVSVKIWNTKKSSWLSSKQTMKHSCKKFLL